MEVRRVSIQASHLLAIRWGFHWVESQHPVLQTCVPVHDASEGIDVRLLSHQPNKMSTSQDHPHKQHNAHNSHPAECHHRRHIYHRNTSYHNTIQTHKRKPIYYTVKYAISVCNWDHPVGLGGWSNQPPNPWTTIRGSRVRRCQHPRCCQPRPGRLLRPSAGNSRSQQPWRSCRSEPGSARHHLPRT